MKPVVTKKTLKMMPDSKWYLSERGMRAARAAFGAPTFRKKAR